MDAGVVPLPSIVRHCLVIDVRGLSRLDQFMGHSIIDSALQSLESMIRDKVGALLRNVPRSTLPSPLAAHFSCCMDNM